jgi:hypothetical protein
LQALLRDKWIRFDVPGFNTGVTKNHWGETLHIVFVYRLSEDHRFDAARAAKKLLEWLQENRPYRTTALMAVVFAKADVLDINSIVPVSEVESYHRVHAGLIDLRTFRSRLKNGLGREMGCPTSTLRGPTLPLSQSFPSCAPQTLARKPVLLTGSNSCSQNGSP